MSINALIIAEHKMKIERTLEMLNVHSILFNSNLLNVK